MGAGQTGGGEHGSAKRERESEDGMLPLDHFEGDAEVAEEGHGKILRQNICWLPTRLQVYLPRLRFAVK